VNSRIERSRNNYWIRTSSLYHVSGFRRLGGIGFNYRSREDPRVEVSGEHMACPSSGDRVVDRWTIVTWEGLNTLLTSHASGSHKKEAKRLNNSSHKLVSSEKC
jgi:hypothetical protein